ADYYPQFDKTFVGGISLNFAVHAKYCGIENVSIVSCIGDDDYGDLILEKLNLEGINTSHLSVSKGKTAHCEIIILENGERYFPPNSYHQNVLSTFQPRQADLRFIQQHDILVSRFDISYTKETFKRVMEDLDFEGKRVADFGDWFDYDGRIQEIKPYLDKIDLAFISGNQETINAFALLSKKYTTQFVVTLGMDGSIALSKDQAIHQKAIPVKQIIDTTGCGDAFQAAFTVAYFRGENLKDALHAGAEQAAKTLQHVGAI
ncbi:MAG: PfkB family carbohydrate kinase, partial [Chloroflexota bacterium]